MAGVKHRSGGKRPGAGRKPTVKTESKSETKAIPMGDRDMLEVLQDVALGKIEATALQVRAAIAAVQYTHIKKHDGGIKDSRQDKAKQATGGKFAHSAPPRLVVNNK